MSKNLTERIDDLANRSKTKRLETWETIKTTDPNLAELMTEINRITGPLSFLKVEIGGKVILKKGEMNDDKNFWNGKIRSMQRGK